MLVSDFPMGSFVSGGIDSSLLSAMAKKPNQKSNYLPLILLGNIPNIQIH